MKSRWRDIALTERTLAKVKIFLNGNRCVLPVNYATRSGPGVVRVERIEQPLHGCAHVRELGGPHQL